MIVQDAINLIQSLSGEGPSAQRFSSTQYIQFVSRAQKIIVRELKWPPSRYVFTTTPTVQEYQLQEVIQILSVYLNGQSLPRTDFSRLEGRLTNEYDQSAQGGGPGGLIVPNQASPVVGSSNTPQWSSQQPAPYPVTNTEMGPYGGVTSWFPGHRPAYYCNGGNIGFIPAPAGALTVVCNVVQQPVTLQTVNDALVLPDIAGDAIAWKVIEYMFFSDKDVANAADQRNYAMSQYKEALAELRRWRSGYDGDGPRGPVFTQYRSYYVRGRNTFGGNY